MYATRAPSSERVPQQYLDDLRGRVLLSDIILKDIPLKRAGREWTARCPFHTEKSPSFFVNDQKRFYHCFGCCESGDHISWMMKYHGMQFRAAVEHLAGEKPPTDAQRFENNMRVRSDEHIARSVYDYVLDDAERSQQAMAQSVWRHTVKIDGTIAERYLRIRGIRMKKLPESIRFAENAWIFSHEGGWKRSGHPGLIAGVQDSADRLTAIQTTYLLPDGSWKAAMRKCKLVTGPMVDGAIRLGEPAGVLCIAEGIETALAAQQMFTLPVWAATGQARRKSIRLPDVVKTVVILADNGGSDLTTMRAKESYEQQGREVMIESPPPEFKDFADQLVGKKIVAEVAVA